MSGHFFWFLLFALGCFCNKHEERWTFTFPESITAVKHSDVEIPCNFTAPADHGEVRIVWFVYRLLGYPIVYSGDSSEVSQEYKGRTSIINGTDSCSLRIKDVTQTERYYPGISEEINSYKPSNEETKKAVQVRIPVCSGNPSCQDWGFTFPRSIQVLRGSCVEIPCKLKYPESAKNFTVFWYKNVIIGYPKIFNSRSAKDVEEKYRGRTFLMGSSLDSCSLRINNVQQSEGIYPGINEEINSYHLHNGRVCSVSVIESPPAPRIEGTEQMQEKERARITCAVSHTCASSPPSIAWNRPDVDATMGHKDLGQGIWRIDSTIQYIPSYEDDKTQLECAITFQNEKISRQSVTLDIKYKPKNVTISVVHNIQQKEGDNVTLQCTSQANPPETQYTWYEAGRTKTGTGRQITVQNVTWEKYICSASNDIGTSDSSEFSLTTQAAPVSGKHKNVFIIGGAAGCAALAIIVLVIIFCVITRRKRVHEEESSPENVQIKEQILMDQLLYGNVGAAPEQTPPRARNSLHGQNDDSGAERNTCQYKEEKCIVYTSVELPSANHMPKPSENTEETEYAQLNI